MQVEKKVKKNIIPKPQSQKKKQQRDQKISEELKKARVQRRVQRKNKRIEILKKIQQQQSQYQNSQKAQILARRESKLCGKIHVPAQPKVAFVIRIRGINKLNPRVVRIFRLLRLRQLHNGVFVRLNKASLNMLRKVQPYVTFGYASRETIKKLIYKRGYGKINKQRIPLSSNQLVQNALGKHRIQSVEDLINEIYTVGDHFKQANNFLWPFKLRGPRGGFQHKRHPFQRRGDWGNRQDFINDLINKMI